MTIIKEANIESSLVYSSGKLIEEIENVDEHFETLLNEERNKAYLKGKKEGEILGFEKGQKELTTFLPLMRAIAAKLLEKKEEMLSDLKREIVEFSFTICEKILRTELSNKEKYAKLIDAYLTSDSMATISENVKVFLNGEDLLALQTYIEERQLKDFRFLTDNDLQRGDFRIEMKTGSLNCTLARTLEDLKSKVLHP